MFKIIIEALNKASEQHRTQSKIYALIGKQRKSDFIKLKLPRRYLPMIELIAMYGINDKDELLKAITHEKNN